MFVAIRPPEPVLAELERFVEPRREVASTLRWTRTESWHITLAFMAEVPQHDLAELTERLRDTAAAGAGLTLGLAGAGSFPSPDRAKLLWTAVTGEVDRLAHLAGNVRSACTRAGIEIAGGRYRPHLTLARINRRVDVSRWLRVFQEYRSVPWTTTELMLYRSELGDGPARYQAVETFPLGPGE
jgi:2'-5' RNA ligase